MSSMVKNEDKSSNEANYLTLNDLYAEWSKLFPLGDKELPALLRSQSE